MERIALCLEHRITVRSELGKGSMFGVVIPYGVKTRIGPQVENLALPSAFDLVAGCSILVIENDPEELKAMQALLECWHCNVRVARSAAIAVALLRGIEARPDVILADYHLDNNQTGLNALSAVQALYPHPVPGVIITADRTNEIQAMVQDAGYHLLNKPLKPARLRSLLSHLRDSPDKSLKRQNSSKVE